MLPADARVGYVLKRFPRYSETFVVNEILAHEAAGLKIDIFSLRSPNDEHFQDSLGRVRSPVRYLCAEGLKVAEFWQTCRRATPYCPHLWQVLADAQNEEPQEVYQAVQVAMAARERRVGHLHAHFATTATTVARLAAAILQIPYTFTAHAKDIFHESVRPADLERKLRHAARTITVSDYNAAYLRRTYGHAAAHVIRLYNGLDLDRFAFQPPEGRPRTVVAVGRLVEKKGFADLIDATALLAGRGCEFTCRIIGTGELEPLLRDQIVRLGAQRYVQLDGDRPQGEVAEALASSAVFAAPCVMGADGNRDGLPTTVLEALAVGTPCVATDLTALPEVIRHEETGLVVPQHAPQQLAETIQRLLNDPALGVRLAQRGRALVEAEFNIAANAARLRDVFQRATMTPRAAEAEVC